jgi:hypothetical protein
LPISARTGTGVTSLSCALRPGSPAAAAVPAGESGAAVAGAVFTAGMMTGSFDLGIFIGALAGVCGT